MYHETPHFQLRLEWSGAPPHLVRCELREAAFQASQAYEGGDLRHQLLHAARNIILPAGPGAALGAIFLGRRGVEVVAATFVPDWLLRPSQKVACWQIRQALCATSPRRQRQLFAEARRGACRVAH